MSTPTEFNFMSTPTKQDILTALTMFVRQCPGMDCKDYDGISSYNAECRAITRDLADFWVLLEEVRRHENITVAALISSSESTFSGRLEIVLPGNDSTYNPTLSSSNVVRIEYCTGQYWPTEYRKAACAVLARAIWNWQRDYAMPDPVSRGERDMYKFNGKWVSKADWLRAKFKQRFGCGLASRWFN